MFVHPRTSFPLPTSVRYDLSRSPSTCSRFVHGVKTCRAKPGKRSHRKLLCLRIQCQITFLSCINSTNKINFPEYVAPSPPAWFVGFTLLVSHSKYVVLSSLLIFHRWSVPTAKTRGGLSGGKQIHTCLSECPSANPSIQCSPQSCWHGVNIFWHPSRQSQSKSDIHLHHNARAVHHVDVSLSAREQQRD